MSRILFETIDISLKNIMRVHLSKWR